MTVNLATGTGTATGQGTDTLTGIERVIGSISADTITGNSSNNRLEGMGGNDTLNGAGGSDVLGGGNGDDAMNGGPGSDICNGGSHVLGDTATGCESESPVCPKRRARTGVMKGETWEVKAIRFFVLIVVNWAKSNEIRQNAIWLAVHHK